MSSQLPDLRCRARLRLTSPGLTQLPRKGCRPHAGCSTPCLNAHLGSRLRALKGWLDICIGLSPGALKPTGVTPKSSSQICSSTCLGLCRSAWTLLSPLQCRNVKSTFGPRALTSPWCCPLRSAHLRLPTSPARASVSARPRCPHRRLGPSPSAAVAVWLSASSSRHAALLPPSTPL